MIHSFKKALKPGTDPVLVKYLTLFSDTSVMAIFEARREELKSTILAENYGLTEETIHCKREVPGGEVEYMSWFISNNTFSRKHLEAKLRQMYKEIVVTEDDLVCFSHSE